MTEQFIPPGYTDHKEAWRRAYLHLYGPIQLDETFLKSRKQWLIAQEKAKQEFRDKLANAKPLPTHKPNPRAPKRVPWGKTRDGIMHAKLAVVIKSIESLEGLDPYVFLFGPEIPRGELTSSTDAIINLVPTARLDDVANTLLTALYEQSVFGYVISGDMTKIEHRGFWLDQHAAKGLRVGKVNWSPPYRTSLDGPIELHFRAAELDAAFPPQTNDDLTKYSPIVRKGIPIYEARWKIGHKAAGIATDQRAIDILKAEDGYSIGSDKFRELKVACEQRRQTQKASS
ncbi:MAG: hypothetical protein ABJ327_17950 [Litoreibacter sp.]